MILGAAISPSVDVTYEVPGFRVGQTHRPGSALRVAGGKTLNVVRAARALDAPVHAVAALGGSTGDWIVSSLAAEAVTLTAVPLAGETRMCLAIVDVAESSPLSTDLYEPPTPFTADEWAAFARAVRGAAGASDWMALSGSIPAGVPLAGLTALLDDVRTAGVRVALDTAGAALRALCGSADLLKINRAEAEELLGGPTADAVDACRRLAALTDADVVVTDGVVGSAARIDGNTLIVPAPHVRGRYPTGSGDAFLGGLLAALDRGEDAETALTAAAATALRNALVPGAGRLASRWRVSPEDPASAGVRRRSPI